MTYYVGGWLFWREAWVNLCRRRCTYCLRWRWRCLCGRLWKDTHNAKPCPRVDVLVCTDCFIHILERGILSDAEISELNKWG